MSVDVRDAVIRNVQEIKRALDEKTSEVARLEKELKRYQSVLELLSENGKEQNAELSDEPAQSNGGRRGRRGALGDVLTRLPETFTSREFMKAATKTKRSPIYLRQLLSRWAKQGRIKRVQRGKYQKSKGGNGHRMAA
jgi:septal ring factor EnvC (AmiA/AmiB activator)